MWILEFLVFWGLLGLCERMHSECHFSLDWNYYYVWVEAHIITIIGTWLKMGTTALMMKENHCWCWNMDRALIPLKGNVLCICASTLSLKLCNKNVQIFEKRLFFLLLLMERDCVEERKPVVCVSPSLRTLVPFCGSTHPNHQPKCDIQDLTKASWPSSLNFNKLQLSVDIGHC